MQKLIKKLVDKYIVKILTIYNKDNEKILFSESRNYLADKIYFETQHLIRLIEESEERSWKKKLY